MLYGPVAQSVPPPTAEPGKAPASKVSVSWAAVILPSRVAPIFVRAWVAEAGPVPSKTSFRVITTCTGRPLLRERIAATGST